MTRADARRRAEHAGPRTDPGLWEVRVGQPWLHGWPRMSRTHVLVGTSVLCIGCGRNYGTTCVALDDGWAPPVDVPAWPFGEADCPVHPLADAAR